MVDRIEQSEIDAMITKLVEVLEQSDVSVKGEFEMTRQNLDDPVEPITTPGAKDSDEYSLLVRKAAELYLRRKYLFTAPAAEYDQELGWYIAPDEWCPDCENTYSPPHAFPLLLLLHARTIQHVCYKYGVDQAEVRKTAYEIDGWVKFNFGAKEIVDRSILVLQNLLPPDCSSSNNNQVDMEIVRVMVFRAYKNLQEFPFPLTKELRKSFSRLKKAVRINVEISELQGSLKGVILEYDKFLESQGLARR